MNRIWKPFVKALQEARSHRSAYRLRHQWKLIGIALALIGVFITLCIFIAPSVRPEDHFVREKGLITALSAVLLAMASGLAIAAFLILAPRRDLYRFFWLLAAGGFLFLAFDELMMFHEKLGLWLEENLLGKAESFRNWDDVIVLGYGIIALPLGLFFLPELLRYPMLGEVVLLAAGFYLLHSGIDALAVGRTTVSIISEESAKLLCNACLALAMFMGLQAILPLAKPYERPPNPFTNPE